jgi:CheY-like chemotaxis protein
MKKSVLWIDDNPAEHEAARRMLEPIEGLDYFFASSSREAENILSSRQADCVVTDILRRNPDRSVSADDGYAFVRTILRPRLPMLPVIFHTKNLPGTFAIDDHAQYLSKWDPEEKKAIELERRLSASARLYEAFADHGVWTRIEPRLVKVRGELLAKLEKWEDVWLLNPSEFEQLVAELLAGRGESRARPASSPS